MAPPLPCAPRRADPTGALKLATPRPGQPGERPRKVGQRASTTHASKRRRGLAVRDNAATA
eukprot:11163362-Lingulodinium_polyedra.AAC.1